MFLRRFMSFAAVLMAVACSGIAAHADSPTTVRKAIQAAYNKENSAMMKKNIDQVLSTETPDYEADAKNGVKMTMAQMRLQLEQLFKFATSITSTGSIQKLTVKGKEATVTVKEHAQIVATMGQKPTPSTLTVDAITEDIWVKTPKGWLKKHSKSIKQTSMMDGKAMPQM